MSIINELWYGNISPTEHCGRNNAMLKKHFHFMVKNKEILDIIKYGKYNKHSHRIEIQGFIRRVDFERSTENNWDIGKRIRNWS